MQLQLSPDSEPIELELGDMLKMTSCGEVPPTALVCHTVLTDGIWMTVDNLRCFHRESPQKYPHGEQLRQQLANQKELEKRGKEIATRQNAYMRGSLIEDSYGVASLSQLIAKSDCMGASRLIFMPSFEPEGILTAVFTSAQISIQYIRGTTSLWDSLPQISSTFASGLWQESTIVSFDADRCDVTTAIISYLNAPEPFSSWDAFLSSARAATNCSSSTLDGVGYRHKVYSLGIELEADWHNPEVDSHPTQMTLVRSYLKCAEIGGLKTGIRAWLD